MAILPTRGTRLSAGLDLHSIESFKIAPWNRAKIRTGIRVCLPSGVYGRIAPRSGYALKNGIEVLGGVIDADYTGELMVILINLSSIPFVINPKMKIAQLIIEKYKYLEPIWNDVENELIELPVNLSLRGDKGFGSTDI